MEIQLNLQKLKQLRKSKAWSQSHLADIAGVSLRTIQRIEKSGVASQESVMSICAAYDLQTSDIIKDEDLNDELTTSFMQVVNYKIDHVIVKATCVAFVLAFIMAYFLTE